MSDCLRGWWGLTPDRKYENMSQRLRSHLGWSCQTDTRFPHPRYEMMLTSSRQPWWSPDSLLARLWHFCRRSVEITRSALKTSLDPKREVTLSEAAGRRRGELGLPSTKVKNVQMMIYSREAVDDNQGVVYSRLVVCEDDSCERAQWDPPLNGEFAGVRPASVSSPHQDQLALFHLCKLKIRRRSLQIKSIYIKISTACISWSGV